MCVYGSVCVCVWKWGYEYRNQRYECMGGMSIETGGIGHIELRYVGVWDWRNVCVCMNGWDI